MSRNVDWKQAMLNEAEASGNEAWAEETRKQASGLRYWGREQGRTVLIAAVGGILNAAAVQRAPAWFGVDGWLPALALCALAFAMLGTVARWYVGQALSPFLVFVLLTLSLAADGRLAAWPLRDWPGALLLALALAAAYGVGQRQGEHWQPFGAWRSFDPADFVGTRGHKPEEKL